jgi:hypothetical protein
MSTYYSESNSETTTQLFDKKMIYKNEMNSFKENYPNLTDFNDAEKLLYGRVDRYFEPIMIRDQNLLKGFGATNAPESPKRAMNFVVDAFNEMARQFTKCAYLGKIDAKDTYLSNLVVYRAYENPDVQYQRYIQVYYQTLQRQFRRQKIKVRNFDEFLDHLLPMLSRSAYSVPFTQTAYIKSRRCPISVSGLAIEIADLDPTNDDEKIKAFINSNNWQFYLNTCKSYGFLVDQAMPWRIVADIGSSAMIEYAAKYNKGSTDSILRSYGKAYASFADFKENMLYLYNLVKQKSFLETEECNGQTLSRTVRPLTYTINQLDAKYTQLDFLKIYYQLRFDEEETVFTDYEKYSLVSDSVQIYNSKGLSHSLIAFERIINKPFDYRGSLSYNKIQLDSIEADELSELLVNPQTSVTY